MRRAVVVLLMVAQLTALPLIQPQASATTVPPPASESRAGVALMVACGMSARITLVQPVPWAGIAVVTCVLGLLNALMEPD